MSVSRFERDIDEGLTRISVRSSADHYLVRTGNGPAVKVRRRGAELECECGRVACSHIASLRMCGFVEDVRDMPRAA
jgi:hypothetical protein